MREQTEREPYHCDRIIMTFKKGVHITDVAYEAVTIAARTLCDVEIRMGGIGGWEYTVTPHMDVPEVVEAYHKQPAWFVESTESQMAALDEEPLVSEMARGASDGLRIVGSESGRLTLEIKDGKIVDVHTGGKND